MTVLSSLKRKIRPLLDITSDDASALSKLAVESEMSYLRNRKLQLAIEESGLLWQIRTAREFARRGKTKNYIG